MTLAYAPGLTSSSMTHRASRSVSFPLTWPESITAFAEELSYSRPSVPRSRLLEYAGTQLRGLLATGHSMVAVANTAYALDFLIGDDSATPQIGDDGENGIETEWLVNGRSLIVNCESDGSNIIWALDSNDSVLFRGSFSARYMVSDPLAIRAQEYLAEISAGVQNRVAFAS